MPRVSAQVSLYPLRQEHFSAAIDDALEVFRRHGLDVQAGAMSTLTVGEQEQVLAALPEVFRQAADRGEVVMVVTLSNACPT